MALIDINGLTFGYDGSPDTIFQDVSFQIDTDWRLGLIGRNGCGKTTFLNLLLGKLEYQGTISSPLPFEYFPYPVCSSGATALEQIRETIAPYRVWETEMEQLLRKSTPEALAAYGEVQELYSMHSGYTIDEEIRKEASRLQVAPDALDRPFSTLSNGEKTKLLLAAMFLRKNSFLLIDEPTNHLDLEAREAVADYLKTKKGFLLVSHDRKILDSAADHILSINRKTIEVQKGNYSSWRENKERKEQFELAQNDKLKKEIRRLEVAADRTAAWSDDVEKTKYGSLNSGLKPDRGYLGHKSAKMMKRSKAAEQRREKAAEEKSQLLQDLEVAGDLKLHILPHPKKMLAEAKNLSLSYGERDIVKEICFTISQGERVALRGRNGCGKSSVIKLLLGENIPYTGLFYKAGNLKVSYIPQDASFLRGSLRTFIQQSGVDESLMKAILRKLDFSRGQFEKDMASYSEGQKKKVLLAKSLSEPATLFVWDEPLNFVDILSQEQIELLLQKEKPTMLFVEHDAAFCDKIATKYVELCKE